MTITTGSNISSLRAQRNLSENSSNLANTYQRLASGLRINKASDDAAGLAIAESLKSDRRVYTQGIRNFNDGISLLNIAESAVESLSNITFRLKELAEQAANGAYSAVQRSALDKEAQALSKEYTRIAQSTKFNGVSLLNGDLASGVRVQGGFGIDGSILAGVGGDIGTGSFFRLANVTAGSGASEVVSADFDGDGNLDLVTADNFTSSLSVLLGNGDGTFDTRVTYSTGAAPTSVIAADFNNDGFLDLAATESTLSTVSIFIGNGNGTFKSRVSYAVGSSPQDLTAGDFNSDGIIDIATANQSSNTLSILLGKADGTFNTATSMASGSGPKGIEVADINGDGISDLVSADYGGTAIGVSIGRGDGTFQNIVAYSEGSRLEDISITDVNGDGLSDVITPRYDSASVSVRLGQANGTLSTAVTYAVGNTPFDVIAGDFNGDGIVDLASVEYSSQTLSVLIGNTSGTFNTRVSYSIGSGSVSLVASDFNNDGVQDIATANLVAATSSIFLGYTEDGSAPILPFDIKTIAGAKQALSVFNRKIDQLSAQKGIIGSFQSRITVGVNNLISASENYAAAESRIRDADIADETSKMLRLQVIQQASTAILAQANLQPQIALQLLGR